MPRDRLNLVWIDLETTGLSVSRRVILEIASIVTDKELNILGEGPNLVIHHSDQELEHIDDWCAQQYEYSGLLDAARASDISLREAEQQTLAFIRRHTQRKSSPLCGNSILLDRRFLMRYMPELHGHLSHRNLDVSTINELAYRWYPGVLPILDKDYKHRSAEDIRASIDELRLYRQMIFRE